MRRSGRGRIRWAVDYIKRTGVSAVLFLTCPLHLHEEIETEETLFLNYNYPRIEPWILEDREEKKEEKRRKSARYTSKGELLQRHYIKTKKKESNYKVRLETPS